MNATVPADLLALGAAVGDLLVARGDTIAVTESSTGGLIAAALLSRPGASAYFVGGAVVYTRLARRVLTGIADADMKGIRSASLPYAELLARDTLARFGTTWALTETGATGPSGNAYGDPAGHSCLAVAGPTTRSIQLRTGSADRPANMVAFAAEALTLLRDCLAGVDGRAG